MRSLKKITIVLFFITFITFHLVLMKPHLIDSNLIQAEALPTSTSSSTDSIPIKRIMIVTTWRSGSTFVGDIIKSAPGVFYSFEPLLYLDHHAGSKTALIQSIFQCQFTADFLRSINGLSGLPNDMQRNRRVWDECHYNRSLCHDPHFIGSLCSYSPVNLIKTVRLRVKELNTLLKNDPSSKDWKIVYLVRDPRGTMSSRDGLKWCQINPACNNVNRLCTELVEDLELIKELVAQFPNRHYLVKFEDLATNVESGTEKLFQFLEMPVLKPTTAFLDSHTKSNDQKLKENFLDFDHSTFRKSDAVAYGWKNKMDTKLIANITSICASALEAIDNI
ncbi:hypothetical protein GHT06_010854 [Daphnia sinensis]|uniref:Sulfotransferase domain-containing protein n=1 Tax=Daphnia sinensis TaxID=1820382 RepID=A0AAD5KZ37_9CRUS|nr:hypothetical protein GHT06_010854 [Daphnia sinensis]